MLERFTDRARQVVVLAQQEARALGHDYIGSDQDLRRDAVALANEAEQDVLGADVVGAD